MAASLGGRMVQATSLDTVRVEVLGESRAVTAPAGVWLEAMRLYKERMAEEAHGGQVAQAEAERVTVADARALCEKGGKGWAVLILGTAESSQFVTWGRSAEQKVYASGLSEHLAEHLRCGPVSEVYESYKFDAARNKERVEQLEDRLAQSQALANQSIELSFRQWSAMGEIARHCCSYGPVDECALAVQKMLLEALENNVPERLGITEALELCRQGKRVRPVCWRDEAMSRWVEARPWQGVAGGVIFVEGGEMQEMPHALRLQCPAEFFGEWEVL